MAQLSVLQHLARRTLETVRRLASADIASLTPERALESFEPSSAPAAPTLNSDKIDLPPKAATCQPLDLVGTDLRHQLTTIADIFPEEPMGVAHLRVSAADRPEYVKFVVWMLDIGKATLHTSPSGVGAFFVVGKPGKDRLRPIWNGGSISEATVRPPMPRRLGNPAAFVDLEVPAGQRLWFSKRDASLSPRDAQKWFCFPLHILRQEPIETPLTFETISFSFIFLYYLETD